MSMLPVLVPRSPTTNQRSRHTAGTPPHTGVSLSFAPSACLTGQPPDNPSGMSRDIHLVNQTSLRDGQCRSGVTVAKSTRRQGPECDRPAACAKSQSQTRERPDWLPGFIRRNSGGP